jgi:hypothetical protein
MLPTAEFIEFFDVPSMKGFLLEAGVSPPAPWFSNFTTWKS